MKQKIMRFLFIFPLFLFFGIEASADTIASVDDQANLFNENQIQQLKDTLAPIETKIHGRIFIVTTNDTITDIQTFTDQYMLDKIGKDANGVTFLIDMNQRNFYISTSGNMIDYFTDNRLESTLDQLETTIVSGNYFQTSLDFLNNTEKFVNEGIPNKHYRIDSETGKITYLRSITVVEFIIAFIFALILALAFYIYTVSKYRLNIANYKYPYQSKSSLDLLDKEDVLIDSFITTRKIQKNPPSGGNPGGGGSTTHTTGGGIFGGGGRSF